MSDEMLIKFWGVRGSHPTPGASSLKYGGNTACVEIRAADRTLVLDAGTGIIPLGRDLARRARPVGHPLELAVLFSHFHHDHTQGFPFFVPAFMPKARLHLFGPGTSHLMLEGVLERNQSPEIFPVSLREMGSEKVISSLREVDVIVWDEDGIRSAAAADGFTRDALVVRLYHSHAHPGGVYVYRIEWCGRSVVYATDIEGYVGTDRGLVRFAGDADLLIHDAQYMEEHYSGQLAGFPSTQGYGHSTVSMACEVAAAANVKRLVLFHHDPAYEDGMLRKMEARAQSLFSSSALAFEGMEIRIAAPAPDERAIGPMRRDVKYAENG